MFKWLTRKHQESEPEEVKSERTIGRALVITEQEHPLTGRMVSVLAECVILEESSKFFKLRFPSYKRMQFGRIVDSKEFELWAKKDSPTILDVIRS